MSVTQQPGRALSTLPGMAPGVVGIRETEKGKRYTLQCAHCLSTEEPEILVLMTFKFHARSQGRDNPRLCRPCRVAAYTGCTCDGCKNDRGRGMYE